MKAHQHEHAHSYQHRRSVFNFKSASLFQSLTTAATIGIFVGSVGVALNAVWFYWPNFLVPGNHGPKFDANPDRHRSGDHRS
jgi:hypothetical protein